MSRLNKNSNFQHSHVFKTGVLIVNLGTPAAATPAALRRYLAEFLSDPRVVEISRLLWWLILHGIILRIRPRRSAKAYQKIWTEQGSPLRVHSKTLVDSVKRKLNNDVDSEVCLAMRYGEPSIGKTLSQMRDAGVDRLLVLPLYPQYSATTTASVFDGVARVLQQWRYLPELRFINHYHDAPAYINALATQIKRHWQQHGRGQKLLMSFHGIPKRNLLLGDPYYCHCQKTARLLAAVLELAESDFIVTFQSRFGKAEWLQPYTDQTLKRLPVEGIKKVDVICPGFAADCLETLEEIAVENKHYFLEAGGEQYQYIPALNNETEHVDALCDLLKTHMQGWNERNENTADRSARARGLGAEA